MNILEEANRIVNLRSEEKERMYGPFEEGMDRAAMIARGMTGKEIDAKMFTRLWLRLNYQDIVTVIKKIIF